MSNDDDSGDGGSRGSIYGGGSSSDGGGGGDDDDETDPGTADRILKRGAKEEQVRIHKLGSPELCFPGELVKFESLKWLESH